MASWPNTCARFNEANARDGKPQIPGRAQESDLEREAKTSRESKLFFIWLKSGMLYLSASHGLFKARPPASSPLGKNLSLSPA